MKQWMRRGWSLLLALVLLMSCAVAESAMDERTLAVYQATGDYLETLGTPQVGSVGGEWMVIGLARSGREVPEGYYGNAVAYIQENADENGQLHRAKSTENSRMILALTAIGADVTDVAGYNLLAPLKDMSFLSKQGNNGPIWALIALDCGGYVIPDGANYIREMLVQAVLNMQLEDSGWAFAGTEADSDMTGMALQSLAPYYVQAGEEQLFAVDVNPAVDAALDRLSQMQFEDGSYGTFDGNGNIVPTSESISQVVTALCALGIDPAQDERFIKNGHSAIDALLEYFVEGGGFKHLLDGERDGMATEQAYYALTAYDRLLSGKTRLYDMTDVVNASAE